MSILTKYVVKNCTSLDSDGTTCQDCSYKDCGADDCINLTDCVIKQVIEKCKDSKLRYSNLEILRTACETNQAYGKAVIAEQILQLFDIEEIRE